MPPDTLDPGWSARHPLHHNRRSGPAPRPVRLAGPRRPRSAHTWLAQRLELAGIRLNGQRACDPQLLEPGVPERVLAQGSLGLGESYLDGHWQARRLDEFFCRLLQAQARLGPAGPLSPLWVPPRAAARWLLHQGGTWLLQAVRRHLPSWCYDPQSRRRAASLGPAHYDLGNDFFAAMLDCSMTYTCAWWGSGASDLDAAQADKLELVCRKLGLHPGMRLLDIGCGWGSLLRHAAVHHGVRGVGVTISAQQLALGRLRCAGLPVVLHRLDYRDLPLLLQGAGSFDRIASLGMFEHVGRRHHGRFLDIARRMLAPDGLLLLHTIGRLRSGAATDPFIDRHVFPHGELPSLAEIGRACERRFVVEDLHNFGADYDRTLLAWHANVQAAWPRFAAELGERFGRLWTYYLMSCAGAFRARDLQLWQWVLSPHGVPGGYRRPPA